MDKYVKVEKMLREYKMIKISITNMEEEIEFYKEQDGITGISSGEGGGGGNKITSKTEDTALRNIEEVKELKSEIRKTTLDIDRLERSLEGLNTIDRQIVEGYYIDDLEWWQVAYSVGYGERQCRRLRTKAINKLVRGVYGKNRVESDKEVC